MNFPVLGLINAAGTIESVGKMLLYSSQPQYLNLCFSLVTCLFFFPAGTWME